MNTEDASESRREADARRRAESRHIRQRSLLRPVGGVLIAIVAVTSVAGDPPPGLHGTAAGVSAALCVYVVGLAVGMTERFARTGLAAQVALMALIGAAGVALAALQPHGASELAASAVVWMAITRLALRPGVAVAALVTVGLGIADALSGVSSGGVLASTLLCAFLGLMAHFMKQSRESQDHTELLLAELQDAREELAEAAATRERSRIAGELHDVLAHSLSGAAIQLQGARLLTERQGADPQVRSAIDRASELVKDGLDDARRAVSALVGDRLPAVEELDRLVESFREDLGVDATLRIEGSAHQLTPEVSLALYRGAQEALTNVARYAPGSATAVVLRYEQERTVLSVEDRAANGTARTPTGLAAVGGGRGLDGMRERVERAGGRMDAGPTGEGWRVQLEVPA
jgi:signal transduction histidine kinase